MSNINIETLIAHIEAGRNVIVGGFGAVAYSQAAVVAAGRTSEVLFAHRAPVDAAEGELADVSSNQVRVIANLDIGPTATLDMVLELLEKGTIFDEAVTNGQSIIIIADTDDVDMVDSRITRIIDTREGFVN